MPQETWQIVSTCVLHDGTPWVKLSSEHVRLPNGVEIEDFYRVDITPYVMIFAVTENQQVILVEHYKHGPQAVSLEMPAGYIEPGDEPLATAQRELREETGYVSQQWLPLGRYFIDGNRGCGWMYGFLATQATLEGEPQREAAEIMSLSLRPLSEVVALWRSNEIINVSAAALVGRALLELSYLTYD